MPHPVTALIGVAHKEACGSRHAALHRGTGVSVEAYFGVWVAGGVIALSPGIWVIRSSCINGNSTEKYVLCLGAVGVD